MGEKNCQREVLILTQLNLSSTYGRRCKTPQCLRLSHLSSHYCI